MNPMKWKNENITTDEMKSKTHFYNQQNQNLNYHEQILQFFNKFERTNKERTFFLTNEKKK